MLSLLNKKVNVNPRLIIFAFVGIGLIMVGVAMYYLLNNP